MVSRWRRERGGIVIDLQIGDGSTVRLAGGVGLLFVDETGTEDMSDRGAHFFGLAGCFIGASEYGRAIEGPWSVVEGAFRPENRPLHASKLRDVSAEQVQTIGTFFESGKFGRLAAVCSKATRNETKMDLFDLTATCFDARIRHLFGKLGILPTKFAIIVEHSTRLASRYQSHFGKEFFDDGRGNRIPVEPYFQRKELKRPLKARP